LSSFFDVHKNIIPEKLSELTKRCEDTYLSALPLHLRNLLLLPY
jgi:hypothetical protein